MGFSSDMPSSQVRRVVKMNDPPRNLRPIFLLSFSFLFDGGGVQLRLSTPPLTVCGMFYRSSLFIVH